MKDEIDFLKKQGYLNLGSVVNRFNCEDLLEKIKAYQDISPDIFLTEDDFEKNPVYKGVNPVQGRNILEKFDKEIDKIESTSEIVSVLENILGGSYEILNKKVICGVPGAWIPEWVLRKIRENPVNNLGAYVKPEYRNITYFYGIDFHQDIIDWPGRELDFVTLYIYLHDVSVNDAPLQLLSGSHQLGVDHFPHNLSINTSKADKWIYKNALSGEEMQCKFYTVTGQAGNVGLWHSCLLHGTQPNTNNSARLSLRYLIAKSSDSTVLDEMNLKMKNQNFTDNMRHDLDVEGNAKLKINYLFDRHQKR